MTVAELIAKLQKLPKDRKVVIGGISGYNPVSMVYACEGLRNSGPAVVIG